MFLKNIFFLLGYLKEDFFRAQYFTKVIAANHSSTDTLFLRRALATINGIYKMNLFKADFYFKGALAVIHLSCTIIFSGGHLQWSNIFTSTVFFKQALAVIHWVNSITSSCSHPFDELPFSYYKRVIATTHSFTFTVFLQNWNFSKGILTIILIPPWFQTCIYWKNFVIRRHHLQRSIFSMIV